MVFLKVKDYSNWEPELVLDEESQWVEKNRPWFKHRAPDVPRSIKFDPIPVHEALRLAAEKYPNNVCVYHKPTDKKYTYREFLKISDKIANALHELGVRKEDSVGIMSANAPEFLFCCMGIMETGASVAPINSLLKETDVVHIIREAGHIKTVFCHKNNWSVIRRARKKIAIENVILIGAEEAKQDTITLEEFINGKAPKAPDVDIDSDNDVAALLFTGGTTGLPKGVMLTHSNLIHDALSVIYNSKDREEAEAQLGTAVVLTILPLCHSFGFQVLLISTLIGAMLVMFSSFNAPEVLEAIEYYKVKTFTGVPIMYQMLINHPDFTERDLSSIESSGAGSAALPLVLANKWREVVGLEVGQGFGLTESSPITHMQPNWLPEIRPASIGVPIVDTDAKIVNQETLEELKVGEIGELLIRGPQVMKGYWKHPEATEKTIVDGWLRTGDLARMDEDGYFYIEGRAKDMLKYKGYKILPSEVEEKLYQHPAVLEAGVIGVPDPNIGETIKAYVVLKEEYRDGKITERDIIEWSKERLASYKYPRQVEFLRALPRTAVGKIFRRKLREKHLQTHPS